MKIEAENGGQINIQSKAIEVLPNKFFDLPSESLIKKNKYSFMNELY